MRMSFMDVPKCVARRELNKMRTELYSWHLACRAPTNGALTGSAPGWVGTDTQPDIDHQQTGNLHHFHRNPTNIMKGAKVMAEVMQQGLLATAKCKRVVSIHEHVTELMFAAISVVTCE